MDAKELRSNARELAARIKARPGWLKLARTLRAIRAGELHRNWGYESFREYYGKELELSRSLVCDILAACDFLRRHRPKLACKCGGEKDVPGYNVLARLSRVEGKHPRFLELVKGVFEKGFTQRKVDSEIRSWKKNGSFPRKRGGEAQRLANENSWLKHQVAALRTENSRLRAENEKLRMRLWGDLDLDKIFRRIALLAHPDKGGENDLMRDVNLLFERLRA